MSRHAFGVLSIVVLLASGCSGDGGTDAPATPAPNSSAAPNNKPAIVDEDVVVEPQSNASFLDSRSVRLDGAQLVPVVSTRAAGMANLSLSDGAGQLTGNLTHSVTNATGAWVALGEPGVGGQPVITLTRESDTRFVLPPGTVLDDAQQADYRAGRLHVVIASRDHPRGEVRAQLSEVPVAVAVAAQLDDIQAKVFTPICAGCHTGTGESLPAVMDLTSADASYDALVNYPSLGEPERLRVQASFAEDSLLIRKLLGTQAVGSRMPFRGTRLDTASIDAIRAWIGAGAPR